MGEKRLGSEIKAGIPHNGDRSSKAESWEGIQLQKEFPLGRRKGGEEKRVLSVQGGP